jgi:tetratricopeptide (TPR) repeat protein
VTARRWPWLVLLAALAVTPARANPTDPQREARAHYEAGLTKYHLGEFDAAINEFKTAYTLSHAPRLLFDIAQAQRLKKDYAQALYSYTTYLRLVPDAPNRADVAAHIAELSQLLAEKSTPANSPAPVAEPPSPAPEAQARAAASAPAPLAVAEPLLARRSAALDHRAARAELWSGVGLMVGGALFAAGAAGCTAEAAASGRSLSSLKSKSGAWNAHYQSVYQDAVRYQRAEAALWALGGTAAVIGTVLAVVGARASRVSVGVSAERSAVGLSVRGRLP